MKPSVGSEKRASPVSNPGTSSTTAIQVSSYSSSAIEKVTGVPYQDYLADQVFTPAGMEKSGLDTQGAILPGRAKGYSRTDQGAVANTAFRSPSFGWGYGALYSTVLDLWNFDRALMNGLLLSGESRDRMWSPGRETPWGNSIRFGMVHR